MSIDLNEFAPVINESLLRGRAAAVSYIDGDGFPAVSFRGSTQIHSATQLAIWVRNPSGGLAADITANPKVTLAIFDPEGNPMMLSIRGNARVDASQNDVVYNTTIEAERNYDPEKGGVAVIIDVTSVRGFGNEGPVSQTT